MGGVLLGSDVTHLTHYAGDVKVHGVYVSLGNIHKDVRNQTSRRAWMLIAYIPISKWPTTLGKMEFRSKQHRSSLPGILNRRLFHYCMEIICEPLRKLNTHEIVDPEGNIRLIFYVLIAYLADLEEQFKIAALDKSNCIHCEATTTQFGSPDPCNPRTSDSILEAITNVQDECGKNADPYEFALGADKYRLGDVEYPFWASLPLVDICDVLAVDLLHGFHKFFFDHPFQWNVNSLGKEEIDVRMKAQLALTGARVFPKGVTHITQMSGKEHRALQKVHLPVVANAPIPHSREITLATRALLDFIFLAQLRSQTDKTLAAFEDAYAEFHQYKDVWIKNGAQQGKKGAVIPHFHIPKLHTARHLAEQVRAKGTSDNYSTEVVEHLHIETLKEPYKATNRKEWKRQTVRYLIRRDKLVDFSLWQDWVQKSGRVAGGYEMGVEASAGTLLTELIDCLSANTVINLDTNHETQPENQGGVHGQEGRALAVRHLPGPGILSRPASALSRPASALSSTSQTTRQALQQPPKKRRWKPDEEREERSAKRIKLSQQTYGLLNHQDIALRPVSRMTVAALEETYQMPEFLAEYQTTTFHATCPMDRNTLVDIWHSIRLFEKERQFHPKPTWRRAQACPPTEKEVAVADPVLYVKAPATLDVAGAELEGERHW